MSQPRGPSAIAALVLLASTTTTYAQESWGIWSDKDGKNTYYFLKNSEFRFSGEKAPLEGVWETGPDICWINGNKGNLMIYADTDQCCMGAQFLGGKLVLSELWKKGAGGIAIVSPPMWAACTNRVLNRADPRGPKGK